MPTLTSSRGGAKIFPKGGCEVPWGLGPTLRGKACRSMARVNSQGQRGGGKHNFLKFSHLLDRAVITRKTGTSNSSNSWPFGFLVKKTNTPWS